MVSPHLLRPAMAELSRRALAHNLGKVREQIRAQTRLHRSDTDVMAIVKADAYGHDMQLILPELKRQGVKHFAVATLEEGIEARKLSSTSEILVLGGTFEWTPRTIETIKKFRLKISVNDLQALKILLPHKTIPLHLKLDSGMNRLGLKPDVWPEALQLLSQNPRRLEGLLTHYATCSDAIFHRQVRIFEEGLRWFWSEGVRPHYVHTENSAALFGSNRVSKGLMSEVANLVRPGLALYGYLPNGIKDRWGLKPVLELVSEVGLVKKAALGEGISYSHLYKPKKSETYGVVPLGYADGISKIYRSHLHPDWRAKSGKRKGSLIVCGAICMDMVMVRAKGGDLKRGDRVAFWGRFPNSLLQSNIVEAYELNLRIAKRIPRLWIKEARR